MAPDLTNRIMKNRHVCFLLACGLLAVMTIGGTPSSAQQPVKPAPPKPAAPKTTAPIAKPAEPEVVASPTREADRKAIQSAADAFVAAFDRGDAKAIAAQWTEQAEFHSDSGENLVGRAAIEKSYEAFFKAQPKCQAKVEIVGLRFPSQDTAIEEGVLWAIPESPALPTSTRYNVLHVREDGRWAMAFGSEWGGAVPKLEDLAWLVGDWKAAAKDQSVEMSFAWNDSKTVLRNEFVRREGDKVTAKGTQLIKVDPASGQLRSFSLDDEGGRGESTWFRDGTTWVAEASGVLPSGEATQSYNLINRAGPDEIVWKSVGRTINGQPTPDTDPVKLERAKTAK